MKGLMLAALGGALAGALLVGWLARPTTLLPAPIVRDLVLPAAMSTRDAEGHRENRYARLHTVEQLLSLPGSFSRVDAAYAIAGRSDSGAVQNLIFDTARVADPQLRNELLAPLLARLTELDPASALQLARSEFVGADPGLERLVWKLWARQDLDAAIAAANALASYPRRIAAVQALFAATGYYGTPKVERIRAATGIDPDRDTLAAWTILLADSSVADAVHALEQVRDENDRQFMAMQLGRHLAERDPQRAAGYQSLFADDGVRFAFSRAVADAHAAADPQFWLTQLLDPAIPRPDYNVVYSAMRALVARDPDAALDYLDRLPSRRDRQTLLGLIGVERAQQDPEGAFAWARDLGPPGDMEPMHSVLLTISAQDLRLALRLSETLGNRSQRLDLQRQLLHRAAYRDPSTAAQLALELDLGDDARDMVADAVGPWLVRDSAAAMSWIRGLDEETRDEMLEEVSERLAYRNPEVAAQLLPLLGSDKQVALRRRIVEHMASMGDADRAESLIARLTDPATIVSLRASLARGLASRDPYQARQAAERIQAGTERDMSYVHIIRAHAVNDPVEAMSWLPSIDDEAHRAEAAGALMNSWFRQDPGAAERWLRSQPRGAMRDHAIAALMYHWPDLTPAQRGLVDSIDDAAVRDRARLQQVFSLARSDPDAAQRLLDSIELGNNYRRDAQRYIDRSR